MECQDNQTLTEGLRKLWAGMPDGQDYAKPFYVGVALSDLVPDHLHTLDLLRGWIERCGGRIWRRRWTASTKSTGQRCCSTRACCPRARRRRRGLRSRAFRICSEAHARSSRHSAIYAGVWRNRNGEDAGQTRQIVRRSGGRIARSRPSRRGGGDRCPLAACCAMWTTATGGDGRTAAVDVEVGMPQGMMKFLRCATPMRWPRNLMTGESVRQGGGGTSRASSRRTARDCSKRSAVSANVRRWSPCIRCSAACGARTGCGGAGCTPTIICANSAREGS